MGKISKPQRVADNPSMSAKWDDLCAGRDFTAKDVPNLQLLCYWHLVVEQCMDDLERGDTVQLAYVNARDDVQAMPQIETMRKASGEIRQLNKLLGIVEQHEPKEDKRDGSVLQLVQGRRSKRVAGA